MRSEVIKDLEFQMESLKKEKSEIYNSLIGINRRIKVAKIEKGQLELRQKTVNDKLSLLRSEIVAIENSKM